MGRRGRPESSDTPESCVKWCSEAECWWLVLLCWSKNQLYFVVLQDGSGCSRARQVRKKATSLPPPPLLLLLKGPRKLHLYAALIFRLDAEQLSAPLATHLFFLGAAKVPWSHSSPLDSTVPVSTFAALLAFLAP